MLKLTWTRAAAWRIQRLHLVERAPAGSMLAVASRLGGLHAQVMSSAELTVWARVEDLDRRAVQRALWEDRTLVKTWAMRGTLHLLPAGELPLWHAALSTSPRYLRPMDNANLANCGIHVEGAKLSEVSQQHYPAEHDLGQQGGREMIRGAGPGYYVMDNTVVSNGRFGIDVQNTSEIWIEGNRISYNRGFWGTTPGGQQPGLGINLVNVNNVTVFDNRARGNGGTDLNWDGKGENRIEANACDKAAPAGACAR